MTGSKEHLADWLRDAYAMEHQGIEMLETQANRTKNYPEMRDRLLRHLEESKRQAERLEKCLKRLGESTSAFKTGLGKMVGTAQALSGLFVEDEIVKGCVAGYVFEHYEIGNYKVLIAASQAVGEIEIAQSCSETMQEEEAMAEWMDEHIPLMTRKFLEEEKAGEKH